jgi:hypothetical protein
MAKTKLYKGDSVIYVTSGQVANHEAMGWTRYPTYAIQKGELTVNGTPVTPLAAELNDLTIPSVDAGTLENVHVRHYQVTPAAVSATAIHAAVALGLAEQNVTSGITQPDVPRTLTIKGNAAGITGDVVITGTNIADEVISDTIALNGDTEVEGVKAFKSVTSILFPAETHTPDSAQQETATVVGSITATGNLAVVTTATSMVGTPKTTTVAVSQGVKQQETATVAGAVTTSGNAKVTVRAAGMSNTPKDVSVALIQGQNQVETATAAGSITTSGNGRATVIAAGMSGGTKAVDFAVSQGVKQQETATVVGGPISTSGNAKVTVTALGMSNTPKDVAVAVLQGTLQAETATVVATITTAGHAKVTITAAGMTGSALDVYVYVDNGDDANAVALKIREELATQVNVTNFFAVSGAGADVILTAKTKAANDVTMNIAIADDDCVGITAAATSADTTAGVAQDNAAAVAGKARTALGLDADVSAYFDVTGSGADIVLTRKAEAADDGTMNIAIDNDSCAGLTTAGTSTNTRAGVAHDNADAIALAARTALGLDADVSAFFTVSGATDQIILTTKTRLADDATMNIALADQTCVGITPAPASADTTAGILQDTAAGAAGKIRTALGIDADVGAYFDISGSSANVILTRKAEAADDSTMNIAIDNDSCAGLTAAPTSADTRAGVAPDNAAAVATKIRAALNLDATVTAFFAIGGSGDDVVITAKTIAPNDTSMNLAIGNGTAAGLTPVVNSVDTTVGAYDTVSIGRAKKVGIPHIVYNAACVLIKLLDGSTDSGTLAVDDDEVEKNLFAINGTPNGSRVLDLYYVA